MVVSVLAKPGPAFVASVLGSWLALGACVPLSNTHPSKELEYYLRDSGTTHVLVERDLLPKIECMGLEAKGVAIIAIEASSLFSNGVATNGPSLSTLGRTEDRREVGDKGGKEEEQEGGGGKIPLGDRTALIMYTSGTTGKPKGVVLTHQNMECMIRVLVDQWEWSPTDRILHFLPVYHLHGLCNALLCALWSGACCEFLSDARPVTLWSRLADDAKKEKEKEKERGHYLGTTSRGLMNNTREVTVFMAVPTIYARMVETWETETHGLSQEGSQQVLQSLRGMRLMVSGSAPLPLSLFEKWEKLTGQKLLERYGMTEVGMILSNPYKDGRRIPGYVGKPLPGVTVKIVRDDSPIKRRNNQKYQNDTDCSFQDSVDINGDSHEKEDQNQDQGELYVKSPSLFKEYLNNPEATREAVDNEGYFKTGDVVRYDPKCDAYQILGRASSDIIKSGGYKISALEVESLILQHPRVVEAIVLGKPHPVWGQEIVAVLRLAEGSTGTSAASEDPDSTLDFLNVLRAFLTPYLASYKIPKKIYTFDDIPKNHMGKVNKKKLPADLNLW